MDLRETVIKGLECCLSEACTTECPYKRENCLVNLHTDILNLLTDAGSLIDEGPYIPKSMYHTYTCSRCGNKIILEKYAAKPNYCSHCGIQLTRGDVNEKVLSK